MVRRIGSLGLAVVMVAGLFLAVPAGAAEEMTFGCAVALTGVFGKDGALVRDAYTFWQETINAKGGIGGKHKIKIVFYDDQSDPQQAAKLIEKLVTGDKVDLLLGGFGSSSVMAASAAAERHHQPYISGGASANNLFERGFKYYFSTLGKATEEVRGCVDILGAVSPKPQTVAIVGAATPFTQLACEGFRDYSAKHGLKVVHYELFPMSLTDYNTLLQKAKAANPDVLLVGSHLAVSLRVMKALKEIDFNPRAVAFSYGPTVPAFIEGLKADAEYVLAASEWAPNLPYQDKFFGSAKEFNQAYQARFSRFPDYVEAATVGGAVALQMVLEELQAKPGLGEAERVKIMERLHAQDVMTVYGRIHFGPDGANVAHPPVVVQVQDGKLVNVFPAESAEAKPRYPMPTWKERK